VDQAIDNKTAIPPHKYPIWIILFAVAILFTCLYSCLFLPVYYTAATDLVRANKLYHAGHNIESIGFYQKVIDAVPTSEEAKIGMAVALFLNHNQRDDQTALTLLEGYTFDKTQWARIKTIMPYEYQKLFTK
jgi:hypothetical protein